MTRIEMITIPAGCKTWDKPHETHSWREGFLWWRKKECPGIPADRNAWHRKIQEKLLEEAKAREEIVTALSHKHFLRFKGYAWTRRATDNNTFERPHRDKDLMFGCRDCPDWYEVRLPRWEFEELTLRRQKVEQSWPS